MLGMCKQYIVKGQEHFQGKDMDQLLRYIYTSVNVIVNEVLDMRMAMWLEMWLEMPAKQREERSSPKRVDIVPADEVIQSTDPDRVKVPGSRSLAAKKTERRPTPNLSSNKFQIFDGGHAYESQYQPRPATPESQVRMEEKPRSAMNCSASTKIWLQT